MMNIGDKALMNEIKCNTIQRSKAKMSSETFQENSYVRVSNYTRILDGGYIRFHQPLGIQKRIAKEKWVVVGKVIYNKRNYCKIKIIENQDWQKELDVGSFWKIEKSALKISNRK